MANDAIKWLSTSDTSKQVAINWPTGATTLSDNFQVNGTTNFSGVVKINGSTVLSGSDWAGGTIPVNKGGTGATSLSSGYALIGNGTNAVNLREIKNNTTAGDLGWVSKTASTELINTNTLAYWNGEYNSGNSNLSKLSTVTSGVWHATAVGVSYGGTGATTASAARANLQITPANIGIVDASTTASGIVNTGTQWLGGHKGLFRPIIYGTTSSANPAIWFNTDTTGAESGRLSRIIAYTHDGSGAYLDNFRFIQYSNNGTAPLATYELYNMPTVEANLSETKTYNVLTDKNVVTIAQGGTGATNASDALSALGGMSVATSTATTGADLNNFTTTGVYYYNGNVTNIPISAGGSLLVMRYNSTYCYQMAFCNSSSANITPIIYTRLKNGSGWGSWNRIAYQA